MSLMDHLLKLHKVDAQVRGLRGRLESAERYLNAQQSKLDTLESEKAELETRRRHIEAKVGNAEAEIKGLDERIEKLRAELNASETNKQYTALLTEINTIKASRSDLETTVLEEMDKIEALNAEIDELSSRIEERTKHRNLAREQLEERKAEVGERLTELEAEREEAAKEVPDAERRIFDELADSYDGEAMAPLIMIDKRNREYACGACHMHAPFEALSVLMGSGEELVRCTACRRILYMQEETRTAVAGKK